MAEFLAAEAAIPTPSTPDQLADRVTKDLTRWRDLAKRDNIRAE